LAASELAKLHGDDLPDGLPGVDIAGVIATQAAIRSAVRSGAVASAHDIAEGGLLVALSECVLAGGVGATLALADGMWTTEQLFGEQPGGFIVSGSREALEGLGATILGEAGGDVLAVTCAQDGLTLGLHELRDAHSALSALFP
jgi:phosphoribosylformylglycinamidine synthase